MDLVIFGIVALVAAVKVLYGPDTEASIKYDEVVEDTTRTTKLNDNFYDDHEAFSEMVKLLGFKSTES